MPIDYERHFLLAYDKALKRPRPNPAQDSAIVQGPLVPLFVVAGPGTGKTAVLTLRILKLIVCDGIPPGSILATTFTEKAAAELRSRLLGWGFAILEELKRDKSIKGPDRTWVENVDINQVATGTLDSLSREALAQHRTPGVQPPVLIDEYRVNTVLVREGLFHGQLHKDPDLDLWLKGIRGGADFGWNLQAKREVLRTLWDRLHQDQVTPSTLITSPEVPDVVKPLLQGIFDRYQAYLQDHGWLDFAMLENEVLQRLRSGELAEWAAPYRVVLVDEYQDTNFLQEQIYFEIVRHSKGALTVVGDDDQSLYRFRGATVELFRTFPTRYQQRFKGSKVQQVYLVTNYRSTEHLIAFSDSFVRRDPHFKAVRVAGKPSIGNPTPPKVGPKVIGIFRDDIDSLVDAVGSFIHQIVHGGGAPVQVGDRIRLGSGGQIGDLCFLAGSPAEFKGAQPGRGGAPPQPPEPRFPQRLRDHLAGQTPAIPVFNPRGRPLGDIPLVRLLGGLLLESMDDRGMVQAQDVTQRRMGPGSQRLFPEWRSEARTFLRGQPGLSAYVTGWQTRNPGAKGYQWPRTVSALELLYGIVHFLPDFHDSPEGQVYLESFTRQLTAMSGLSGFEGGIITDPASSDLSEKSVRTLLCDWLAPIADGVVDLDEAMTGSFPRDHLSILSIHQSKGLEFPLVMVDVGADFKTNHRAHAFKRFPKDGGMPHTLEDLIRPLQPALGAPSRDPQHRAFDDLERLYYVAYTRAQQVLVLVGLNQTAPQNRTGINNVATGWDRNATAHGVGWPLIQV